VTEPPPLPCWCGALLAFGIDVGLHIPHSSEVAGAMCRTAASDEDRRTGAAIRSLGEDITEEVLRTYAASVDAHSEHPIANAIAAASENKLTVDGFKSLTGKGAEGRVREASASSDVGAMPAAANLTATFSSRIGWPRSSSAPTASCKYALDRPSPDFTYT
jgi:hypothetical protein